LIGCNYTNIHGAELKASHDDIGSMKVSRTLNSHCCVVINCSPLLF
jgi:hypothetical protein